MSIVYLDGAYMPMEEAKISPMDRGFLFGDGIYEVVPSYDGKMVGFGPHIDRMIEGMGFIDIKLDWSHDQWKDVCDQLIEKNGGGNLGIYLHVSRGADSKRFHAYPDNVAPTVFAFAFEIPPATVADKTKIKGYKVNTQQDLRWDRCNIKSTALLGNVMHFQVGHAAGMNETLLFNANDELTEASACNAYIVKDGVVATPPLDHQCLPGITRKILLSILAKDGSIKVEERIVTKEEVLNADEVWITSSSKEIAPVIEVDGKPVGNGEVGDVWLAAQTLYSAQKYDY
ncbi:D-amino acid aminotransferase [Dasania sp. GY-MA-18]|uniref:Aminodeoxychorismate lyase n=1 Tax=Dasania phycosphaerae TaxID=2950436 RepID=A0A9J6RNJ7_9GAMM|nr:MULTISPECIES: D-amino acid aminotransferase [Dasania]MCR8923634.1 D-amino acid aminotransferase [Dasania sp. GY-MA-18]MCZ0866068.1 D-amino acid aminotransferase [Dasania phycosphaerae]MCZ0869792.1 D-amino acid aminotransferase [Dasania phycosphaerae]